ncbi:N/A [soil metagenome]
MRRITRRTRWLARGRGASSNFRAVAALVVAVALVAAGSPPAGAQRGDGHGGDRATHADCAGRLADRDTVSLRRVREHINVPADGPTGTGVGVAVIDTGINAVAGLRDDGKIVDGPDLSLDARHPELRHRDLYGHGTNMAEIIAGTGSASGAGVAPGAHLINSKVGAGDGAVDASQVIAGIDWVVAHRDRYGIRVLNLSFGTDAGHSYRLDPLAHAVENAWRAGIVVVVAGGNDGRGARRLENPAINPSVIAVGASTRSNRTVAPWSSTGDRVRHPDLVAPGEAVLSAGVPGSYLATTYPDATCVDGDGALLLRGSGTSQSAAVVSGAVAVLLEQRPDLTPDQVKHLLTSTAVPLASNTSQTGHGRLDLGAALAADSPGSTAAQLHARSGARSGAPWSGATWSGATWSGATWSGATWSGATWSGATWSAVGWE